MSKFTPGPWSSHGSHIYSPDGKRIAMVYNPGEKDADYPLIPNVCLMRLAPEMYGLLKAISVIGLTAAIARENHQLLKKIDEIIMDAP